LRLTAAGAIMSRVVADVIRTARTILRPVRASDVDDILEYAADPEWRRYLISLPAASYTRADAEHFVAGQALLDRDVHPSWALEFQGHVVGGLSVRFFHDHRVGELGYGLARRLWGQGLAVEAARAIIGACFSTYPQLARFRATTDARNVQSLRVMEKLGMTREALLRNDRFFRGELVDEVVCGLLRSEWT
jgi:ribosomal-protein-alanine N-acetyltransferase